MKNRININDLPPQYQEQARKQLEGKVFDGKTENLKARLSLTPAVVERRYEDDPAPETQIDPFDREVSIHFHSRRRRLADLDNLCEKASIDALVKAGIFEDDNQRFVGEITHTQEKIGPQEEETTIVTITERS